MIDRREARYASVALLLGSGYLWLARNLNGSIAAYSDKPLKLDDERWLLEECESKEMWMWADDGDLYNFVKCEDDEPVNIREWLKKEEEEMKMYSVKDGESECREVDAGFFDKNTTLGGLLTPRELDRDIDYRPVTLDDLNVQIHGKICQELTETYKKKNSDYGNSFENSLDKHGLIAGIVRMDDKMSRLISLNSKKEQQDMDESLRDTLMDLANYAIMSVMWLDEQ